MATNPRHILSIFEGDILQSRERVILHQCNCVTTNSGGLAGAIARDFPYADPYEHRRREIRTEDRPGTIRIWGHPLEQGPTFVGLFAQFHPAAPAAEASAFDSMPNRLQWLNQCLHQLSSIQPPVPRVALPYNMGCGNGGGDWRQVENVIIQWARETGIQVAIYYLFG